MRRRLWSYASSALLLALPAVVHGQSESAARREVDRTNLGFASAFKTGNADAASALTTENVVIVEPDGTRSAGRATYAAVVKQYFSTFTYREFTVVVDEFGSSGSLAWASGTEAITFVEKASGKSTSLKAQYLAIYERQTNGRYLMRQLMETPMPDMSKK